MILKILSALLVAANFAIFASTCGTDHEVHRSSYHPPAQPTDKNDPDPGFTDPYIVKARWTFPLSAEISFNNHPSGDHSFQRKPMMLSSSNATVPMNASVAANVTFRISTTNFSTPTPNGVSSYGTVDVTTITDNALRTCGAGGTKCTQAAIRVYTSGTTGGGLWSDIEGYGLPISTSGGATVGLNAGAAAIVSSISIPISMRVLHLSDFTSLPAFQIPFSVDFTNAAAASDYATTLVIEYITQ